MCLRERAADRHSDILCIDSDLKMNGPVNTLNCLQLLCHELLTCLYNNVCPHALAKDGMESDGEGGGLEERA